MRCRAWIAVPIVLCIGSLINAATDPFVFEVRQIYFVDTEHLEWVPYSSADGAYNVYRTDQAGLQAFHYGTPVWSSLIQTSALITEVPPLGGVYFYLVSRVEAGREGTLGYSSAGLVRGLYQSPNAFDPPLPDVPILMGGYDHQTPEDLGETDINGDAIRDVWDEIAAYANIVEIVREYPADPFLSQLVNRNVLRCKHLSVTGCSDPAARAQEWLQEASGYSCITIDELGNNQQSPDSVCAIAAAERIRRSFDHIVTYGTGFFPSADTTYLERVGNVTDLHVQEAYTYECRPDYQDKFGRFYADLGQAPALRNKSIFGVAIAQRSNWDYSNDASTDFLLLLEQQLREIRTTGRYVGMDRGVMFWVPYRARTDTVSHALRLADHYFAQGQTTPYPRISRSFRNPSFDSPIDSTNWSVYGFGVLHLDYRLYPICDKPGDRNYVCDLGCGSPDLAYMQSARPWTYSAASPCGRFLGSCDASQARVVLLTRGAGDSSNEVAQTIDVSPSTHYVFSALVQSINASFPFVVTLRAQDARGAALFVESRTYTDVNALPRVWNEIRLQFTTLPTTSRVRFAITDEAAPPGTQAFLDFVEVMPFIDLQDASFEADANGWRLVDGDGAGGGSVDVVSYSTEGIEPLPDMGSSGLRLVKGDGAEYNEAYNNIDIEPLTSYRASCWVRSGGAGAVGRLLVRDLRANIVMNEEIVIVAPPGQWVQVQRDFRTKSSTHQVRFMINDFKGAPGQVLYADYCQIRRLDPIGTSYSLGR